MQQVTLEEAQTHLQELVNAAAQGEDIFIIEGSGTVVQLVPRPFSKRKRQAGSAKGLIWMTADFDAPLDDFKEYME